jgi:hypothetical protein
MSTRVLDSSVRCSEPPNSTLTYPFVILQANWGEVEWRFYVRLRVEVDHAGIPSPISEETTAQRVGSTGS